MLNFIKSFIKDNATLNKIGTNLLYARVAKYQRFLGKQSLELLKGLKGSHKGERCFIIGTGPSLSIEDLELLKGEVTFGTNRIYELFEKTDWRPTFYINQDSDLIRTYSDRIKMVPSVISFLPIDFDELFIGDNYRFFVLRHKEYYPYLAPFSKDISKQVCQGFSVVYGAIQIAVYMGFTEIYLLGVDHNYSISRDAKGRPIREESSSKNYPIGMNEYSNMNNLPRVQESTLAFEKAEKVSRRMGFRVYNATRGGKLEAFERCQLEDIVKINH